MPSKSKKPNPIPNPKPPPHVAAPDDCSSAPPANQDLNPNPKSIATEPLITAPIIEDPPPPSPPPPLRIFIIFYSMYGHVETLAREIKKGVDSIDGVQGVLYRVPETLPPETLVQMKVAVKSNEIPVISVEELTEADGFLFGFPARYGAMSAQMKAFFDSTEKLGREQRLAGVPAGFFVGTGTQGGGQETTAWTAITVLAHHGMPYVPIGYTFGDGMFGIDYIRGGSPYGAGFISGDGTTEATQTEVALAQHHGKYMASIVKKFNQPNSSN